LNSTFEIQTQDGPCEAHAFFPGGAGPFPPVLLYMDAIGMRPAMDQVAERIAGDGYYVLMPDIFHRTSGWKNQNGQTAFSDPVTRNEIMTKVIPSASPANVMRDTEAFFDHFAAEPRAKKESIAIVGFCMGGRLALYAAGYFGDRVGAAAAYHPGGVATDSPESPHRLAPQMKATLYIGRAMEDNGFDDAAEARLRSALDDAGVDYTLEQYHAKHGWVPSDMPAHDRGEAERSYRTLRELLRASMS